MRACACVHASVSGCECMGVGECPRACSVTYPVSHVQAPYCLRLLWLHHIFRYYLINGTIFGKTLRDINCVFLFSLQILFETFIILRRNHRDIVINVKTVSSKEPVIFAEFQSNLNVPYRLSKMYQISIFIKIRPAGAELFYANRQTDRHTDRKTDGMT